MRNLVIDQGSDLSVDLAPILDENSQPVDVTAWHAKLQVRKTPDTDPANITLSTTLTSIANGGVTGQFKAVFVPAHTTPLDAGIYYWDWYTKDGSGLKVKRESGYFTINPSMTRDIS